ncbi:flagellar basal body-associated FliL family protein [Pseudooceanicola sp. 502str34]|uniref:flagellar basal body-associated FliL family protein n=1 Tax=Maritimibacter alkaliphilus TaxID=404236 RepID=UPI001C94AD15|nr:flagellar basal body-associated FliL family protein [Maritimibacter alkaliphilus]MBY6090626.1 flagellar basal body-associated FliL family protein [Maritimibacter alkaliphilus]
MTDAPILDEEPPKKASKLPLILGLVLMLVGGGGSFFAVYSGMLFGDGDPHSAMEEAPAEMTPLPDVAFVAVDPMVISMGRPSDNRHLRFRAQLEVGAGRQKDVEMLLPRVVDVLNSYLRALELRDLEDPAALIRLRSQMLRRVQVVTGPDMVRDLLIMEFVLT